MNRRELRPLKAAAERKEQPSTGYTNPKRQKTITKVACNACRSKKSACDGRRPICHPCRIRGSGCEYITLDERETPSMALKRENESLKGRLEAMEDEVERLSLEAEKVEPPALERENAALRGRMSEMETFLEAFNHMPEGLLRTAQDPIPALDQVQRLWERFPGHQLSEHNTALGILPPVHSELEFKLMVQYPGGYPMLHPSENNDIMRIAWTKVSELQHHWQAALPKPTVLSRQLPNHIPPELLIEPAPASGRSSPGSTLGDPGPGLPGPYLSQLLERLDISHWTNVQVTDRSAAEAISLYFEKDHPILGIFNPELFLDSLLGPKSDFCSPFIANSLLAFASLAFVSTEPEALNRSYEFAREAQNLWQGRKAIDSVAAIGGLIHLFLSLRMHGDGETALFYIEEVLQMAARMQLLSESDSPKSEDMLTPSAKEQDARARIAWPLFNITTLHCPYYDFRPIEDPPSSIVPQEPQGRQGDHEEKSDPLNAPTQTGGTFAALCKLLTIYSKYIILRLDTEVSQADSLSFSLSGHAELLALIASLPKSMICNRESPPHVRVFHIWYHTIILDMFRPFIQLAPHDELTSPPILATTAEALFTASLNQLKRLILVYSGRHRSASYCIWWQTALHYVIDAVLKDTKAYPDWLFYFLLCMRSYQDLAVSFPVMEGVMKGLLAMAVDKGAFNGRDALALAQALGLQQSSAAAGAVGQQKQQQEGNEGDEEGRRSNARGFVLDLDYAVIDRSAPAGLIETLVGRFEDISVFGEFTHEVV